MKFHLVTVRRGAVFSHRRWWLITRNSETCSPSYRLRLNNNIPPEDFEQRNCLFIRKNCFKGTRRNQGLTRPQIIFWATILANILHAIMRRWGWIRSEGIPSLLFHLRIIVGLGDLIQRKVISLDSNKEILQSFCFVDVIKIYIFPHFIPPFSIPLRTAGSI